MAGSKTGTPTIWRKSREIARLYNTYGAADMSTKLSSDFQACITGLVACVQVILSTDEQVLKIDRVSPYGPEDEPLP